MRGSRHRLCEVRCAQRGATLVEALVAALVLATGVLGTAVLFLHGIQGNRSALLRAHAVNLAADLAERIRANPQGRGVYAGTPGPGDAAGTRALQDLAQWRELVLATLPVPIAGSAAEVSFREGAPALPDRYRILLTWSEPGNAGIWTQSHALHLLPSASP